MILDVTLRSEELLREMSARLVRPSSSLREASPLTRQNSITGLISSAELPNNSLNFSPQNIISPHTIDKDQNQADTPTDHISNAALSPLHASTTESILAWPQFAGFHALRHDHSTPVFQLESTRPPLPSRPVAIHPYIGKYEIDETVQSFERNINFWYPTMSREKTMQLRRDIMSGVIDESTGSCLAFLVIALGCAGELICNFAENENPDSESLDLQNQRRTMSELYFDIAFKKIYLAQAECSVEAAQCLFFTG